MTLPENTKPNDFYPYHITKYQIIPTLAEQKDIEINHGAIWYDENGSFIGDGKRYLELADDAATAVLGAPWSIPPRNACKELQENCTFEETTQNGVDGFKIIGPNGNSIFVPKAGIIRETGLVNTNQAYFWVNELSNGNSSLAQIMKIEKSTLSYVEYRYTGLPIRPVRSNTSVIIPDGPIAN